MHNSESHGLRMRVGRCDVVRLLGLAQAGSARAVVFVPLCLMNRLLR